LFKLEKEKCDNDFSYKQIFLSPKCTAVEQLLKPHGGPIKIAGKWPEGTEGRMPLEELQEHPLQNGQLN
jgi:hypothetical protein